MAIISINTNIVSADSFKYAKINDYSTYIYKTPSLINNYQNKICLVEPTYFVKVISVGSNYFEVEYNSIRGYIDKTNVHLTASIPNTPYPTNVTMITGNTCILRNTPEVTSLNAIASIPKNTTSLTYIGRIYGQEAMDFGGNTWYYVKYNNTYGYVYNKYIDSISSIFKNTESAIDYDSIINIPKPLNQSELVFYIIILSIPFLVVLCILYFPTKQRAKNNFKHKE